MMSPHGIAFSDKDIFISDTGSGVVFKLCTDDDVFPNCDLCANYPHGDCPSTCESDCQEAAERDPDDNDLVCNNIDNSLFISNFDRKNYDKDSFGDACLLATTASSSKAMGKRTLARMVREILPPDGVGDVCVTIVLSFPQSFSDRH